MRFRTRLLASVAVAVALTLVATACGRDNDAASSTDVAAVEGSITVFAAASLTEAFEAVGEAFTAVNPKAEVTFGFDASSALVRQITQGAPADVFASADITSMDKLTTAGLSGGEPVVFAKNRMAIIVPPGNPARVTGVADLAQPRLKLVLCDEAVPCGRYAKEVLTKAGVAATPVSFEQNVKGVVTKVTTGEADAGMVYATDVRAAGSKAEGVAIPDDLDVVVAYPIATTKATREADVAEAFVAFLAGPQGQQVLSAFGFESP